MDISIIIPNYNGEKILENCLNSLYEQTFNNFDIIVIDNDSKDKSIEILQGYNNIKIIKNKANFGFAKAINQGIKSTNNEYVLLLNNDIVLDKYFIEKLYKQIQKNKNTFSVQSKMIQYHNRQKIDDAGDEYTILGWAYQTGNGESSNECTKPREIFSSCAGAAIYRKSMLEKIGYFDENFFAYMEDVDIGYRSRIHGYKNIYCSEAICYHIGSATSGSRYNEFKIKLAARNNIYVAYKNMPLIQLIINLPFLITGYIIKYIFFTTKGYGKVYIEGIKEGLKTLKKIEKVKYSNKNLLNYIKIEWLLIKNTFKYIISKVH